MNKMKKVLTIATCLLTVSLNAQMKIPQLSPKATVKQTIGLTNVEVEYSRPNRRERAIFGELVSYDELWRTGANRNTVIKTDHVMIFGKDSLQAGSYALFAKPGKDEWKIYFYSDIENWGTPEEWDDSKVALETSAKSMNTQSTVESFTISFNDVTGDGAELELSWENTKVAFPFMVETKSRVIASIEDLMGGPSYYEYFMAANYYLSKDNDLDKALTWINKALDMSEGTPYWMLRDKSLIQAGLGKKEDAIATAKKSLQLAKEDGDDNYVKMNEESIKEWSN